MYCVLIMGVYKPIADTSKIERSSSGLRASAPVGIADASEAEGEEGGEVEGSSRGRGR
jgi:hypothetical protein